jgi:type I restriction enzyme S subunit
MAGEWREATVSDIASSARNALVGGPFGSNLVSRDYVSDGVPVIRGQNMGERWVSGDFVFVPPAKATSLGANMARPGDIVFTQRGTIGQVCVVPEKPFDRYLVSQSQMKLTVNREVADPLFFYYVFSSAEQQDYIQQHAIQTGVPHTNLGILRRTPVPLPPLPEQRAIAHILGTLDDKIELNRRMNETLEAMARALFQSWFVDFDPVRARRGDPPWSPGAGAGTGACPYMTPEILDLFPDRFEDSELGEIPAGWCVGALDDIASVTMGLSPDGTTYNVDGIGTPLINGPVEFGDHFPVKTKWTTSPTRLAQSGDLILCVRGSTTGRRVVADGSYCLGRGVCAIRAKSGARTFLYQAVNTGLDRLLSKTTGSVFPNLSAPDIKGFQMLVPSIGLIEAFNCIAEPLTERAEASVRESRTLAALRDTLLPKLISGELRVRDAQRFVDGVDRVDEVDGGGA